MTFGIARRHVCRILALAAVAACGGGSRDGSTSRVLRIPVINDPILNPVIAPDIGSVMVNKVIFPGLVRPNESLQPVPDLAVSWQESADGREVVFQLRPGVKWHDGAPFTSKDVKFTFDQVLDVSSGSRLRSDFAAVMGVDVIDSLTVRFRLNAPFAPLLTLLGYNAGILPEHLLRGRPLTDAIAFNRGQAVGTGPFRIAASEPGSALVLERNPDYFGDTPQLDGIVFRVVPDINAQVAQLRSGELDLATIEPANIATLENAAGIRITQVPVVQHWYVAFNTRNPLFSSAIVRRALNYAVNRKAIVDGVLKGYGDVARGTIPVALRYFYDSTVAPTPFAPDSALALLAEAGWARDKGGRLRHRDGGEFRFDLLVDKGNPTREQAALAVQQDLDAIGMTVAIRTMEFAALVRDHVLPGAFEANLIWWTTPPDPDQFAFYATGQDNNNVKWSNPRADSLLSRGRSVLDSATRKQIYAEFQHLERNDPPVLVLFYPREIQAMTDRLMGMPALGIRDALRHSERLALQAR